MKTFKDLKFKKHSVIKNSEKKSIDFDNGHWITTAGGDSNSGLYGDGDFLFEIYSSLQVKSWKGFQGYKIKGWQTKKQVTAHMRYLQSKQLKS